MDKTGYKGKENQQEQYSFHFAVKIIKKNDTAYR
jgi:hypothetical protein